MDPPATNAATPPPPAAGIPPDPSRKRGGGGQKRKSSTPSSSSSGPSKRLIKERNALNIGSSPLPNGRVTRARQSPNKFAATPSPPASAMSSPAPDGGKLGPAPIGSEEEEQVFTDEPIVDTEFDAVRSRGSSVHVVPIPAGWFSWKDIHPIEKHTLASFFYGKVESRTPEIYMEIRNYIMNKFHADPQTQLELKDLAEISAGDSEARQEVLDFLNHWGLINFHPLLPLSSSLDKGDLDAGQDKVVSSLIEKLYEFEAVQSCPRVVPKKVEISAPAMPKFLPESTIAEDLVGAFGSSVEYHCNSCSADCSRKRYHCQKQADFDLCTECYNNGKFGSGMTAADFILMEPAEVPGVSGGSWTDQETLLLLEALELFGENWNEIAEHVATKTKDHCVLHFLQMPIEDPFLDGVDDAGDKIQEQMHPSSASKETSPSHVPETKLADNADGTYQLHSSSTDVPTKKDARELELSLGSGASFAIDALKAAFQAIGLVPEQGLPSFAEAGNPVMALAVFLTHLVDSDAATTSHRSSLKALSEESPGLQLATRHCFILEGPPNDMKDSPASESTVADMGNGETPKTEDQMSISNGSDELKASNGSDVSKPSNGSDKSKPSNRNDDLKPSNGSDELKTSNGNDELMPSNHTDQLEPSNGSGELKPSNGSDELRPSSDSDEPKPLTENNKSKPSNGSDEPKDCTNKNEESAVPVEHEISPPVAFPDCLEKPSSKVSSDSDSPPQAAPSSSREPDVQTLQGQLGNISVEDKDESVSPMILSSNNSKEPVDKAFQGKVAPNSAKETNVLEVIGEDKADSLKESGKLALVDDVEAISDTSMAVDSKPTSAPSLGQDSQRKGGTDSTLDITEIRDGDDKQESPSSSKKNRTPPETNNDHKRKNLKRAAVTVLSAAAVKAKLLGNEEEDQIRQLVSLVIEKQLHKLETKLALFTEIENVIMRVREQTERARQRLIHERAQIIAARFGLPAPPARGNPMALPTSKFLMGYATTGSRPPTMTSQKTPPMRRP